MKTFFILLIPAFLSLSAVIPSSAAAAATGTVIRVIDGDSLLVREGGEEVNVRLIGIDAPEAEDNPKAEADASNQHETLATVIKNGKEAAQYLKRLLHPGVTVTLVTDVQSKDIYGRLLAYVYLPDGKLLNEAIVRAGYAVPLVIEPDTRFRKKFQSAYESALKAKRGLWAKPIPGGLTAVKRRSSKGRYYYRRRVRATPVPGPQTDVTDQKDVSDQKEVSGKPGRFK